MNRKSGWAAMAAATLLVAGCGGGGGGSGAVSASGASAGITSGTITGFGSVIVNGVRYRTSGATEFDVDDGPGGQDDLAVGQQVTVRWTSSDGGQTRDASIVKYDDTLEGPIAGGSIDLARGTFVVLGQLVQVGPTTSFDDDVPGRSLAGLVAGDRVEVSGLIDANGVVRATRIELDDDDDDGLEVRGFVAGLDPVGRTFVINSLTVDYSGVAAVPVLADGDFVEVEGDDLDGLTLLATKVEREDDDNDDDDNGNIEIEGFVTAFASLTDFEVRGLRVTTSSRTRFDDGTAADLDINVWVEVEGRIDSNGVLVAEKIEYRDDLDDDDDYRAGRAEIEDLITSIPAADTIVAGGVTIRLTNRTRFEDHGDGNDQFLNAAALRVGDFVEVRGIVLPGNVVEAVILERDDDDDDDASLRGPVTGVAQPAVSILGVSIDTDGSTRFEDDDATISAAAFFAAVQVGDIVEAEFRRGMTPRVAREVELETDDDDDSEDDDSDDGSDDD